jgi:Ap4A phosphorylase N-terminal domain/ATP adenylyltransferase C-terminal domain
VLSCMSWLQNAIAIAPLRPSAAYNGRCVQAYPNGGLAYFNRGPVSGASQPHKHLQVVPLPLSDAAAESIPMAPIVEAALRDAAHNTGGAASAPVGTAEAVQVATGGLEAAAATGAASVTQQIAVGDSVAAPQHTATAGPRPSDHVVEVRALPFQAFASRIDDMCAAAVCNAASVDAWPLADLAFIEIVSALTHVPHESVVVAGAQHGNTDTSTCFWCGQDQECVLRVCRMSSETLAQCAAAHVERAGLRDGDSHNMLMTSSWLLTVPRGAASDGVVGANAMGFSGAFLVRGDTELGHIRCTDPMAILTALGRPW